jgi:putative exporter of polyketide antibiotics
MIYDRLLPNLMLWVGMAVFLVAVVLISRSRGATSPSGERQYVWGYVLLGVGLTGVLGAMWVDGDVWLIGRILGLLLWLAGIVVVVLAIRRVTRRHRNDGVTGTRPGT